MMNSVTEELIPPQKNIQEREEHITKELKTGQYLQHLGFVSQVMMVLARKKGNFVKRG